MPENRLVEVAPDEFVEVFFIAADGHRGEPANADSTEAQVHSHARSAFKSGEIPCIVVVSYYALIWFPGREFSPGRFKSKLLQTG